jgi:DNA-binding MarR family transcriptional regulator
MRVRSINDDVCLCMTLRRAARAATRLYDELMEESDLKITQFSLLRNIAKAGTINVTELAKKLELERTAMGRNLDLLERRGLIRNEGLEVDQRTRLISLTDDGRQALETAIPVWKRAQTEMRRRLQKGRFAALSAVLAEMQNS